MLHDILVPSRIGNYYLYKKRILSFEISPMMVQGLLFEYSGNAIQIQNKQSIFLKDFSIQAQASALKKIASNIGAYDEIITTFSSSAVVYKELRLPFIGRDALQMIVAYEVESLLPFALEDAVLDFIITQEDSDKKESTLLVAAVRKEDLQQHQLLFEKAEIPLNIVTIDMFVLYEIYRIGLFAGPVLQALPKSFLFDVKSSSIISLWKNLYTKFFKKNAAEPESKDVIALEFQPKRAELLVDIGFDVVRVLYMQDGILSAVRMIPMGVSDIAQHINQQTQMPYYDVLHDIVTAHSVQGFSESLGSELKKIFEEIERTLLFFEKQENQIYMKPHKIWFSGLVTTTSYFQETITSFFGAKAEVVSLDGVMQRLKIMMKSEDVSLSLLSLGLGLFVHYEQYVNFLKLDAQKNNNSLLNKQLLMILFMTIFCLGGVFWRSFTLLQEKESMYSASKKQFIQTIQQRMNIDLRGEKNVKTALEKAEDVLTREKSLWFSFSAQQERSILEYLQDLSIKIDRASTGLELKSMHLDHDKVTMIGSVKSFEALEVFEEELMSLQLLQVVEKPRELSFTVQLKSKEKGQA